MALYAFDGTWNAEKTRDNTAFNTNVVRFKNAYQSNAGRAQCYFAGIGTRAYSSRSAGITARAASAALAAMNGAVRKVPTVSAPASVKM